MTAQETGYKYSDREIRSLQCGGLLANEYAALVRWVRDPNRKPALHAFTSGHTRDAARAFEEYSELRPEQKEENTETQT